MKWYVIRTGPQADDLAVRELDRSGFETFSPRVKTPSPLGKSSESPLFPGYLFLRWDLEGRGKPSFRDAPHVAGLLNFGGESPPVPDKVVAELADKVNELNRGGGRRHRFQVGEKVRVASDSMEGLAEVTEEGKSPRSRIKVLMQFMGRLVSAQVPGESLRPVGEYPEARSRAPRRTRGRGRWIRGFRFQPAGSA